MISFETDPGTARGTTAVGAQLAITEIVDKDEQDVELRLRRRRLGVRDLHRRAGAKSGRRGKRGAAEQYAATVERADIHSRAKIGAIVVRTHILRPSRMTINSLVEAGLARLAGPALRTINASLVPHCKVLLEPIEFASLVGTELIGAELDLDLIERATELERHLRIVLVDNRRSRVLADVKTFVE
jgi:hypothetical protein